MNNGEIKFVFCTECGAKNDINANFCTSCGNKLVKPEPVPVVIPEPEVSAPEHSTAEDIPAETPAIEEPTVEEPTVEEPTEEVVPEETKEEDPAPEIVPVIIPVEEEPAAEEAAEEEPAPEVVPVIIPEAEKAAVEEPAVEEPAVEETKEEETAPVVAPVVSPAAEEPKAEEPAPKEEPAKEEKKEEPAPIIVVPAPVKVSKKEAKLEKKLEEAKKQAQEEARKQAEKEAEKARKAEEKAEKVAAKARAAEEKAKKAEKKAKKAEKNAEKAEQQISSNQVVEQPKKKRKQNFFLKILSFLLAIILMASLIIAIPITLLNLFLTDHNIEVIVDRAISSIELDKIEFSTADGTKTLSSALHDITNEFEGWDHITEEQINDALLEDFVKQFVTDALAQLGMSLKEGEAMLGWTPEQIYDFIEDNKDTIEQLARDAGYEGKLPITEKKEQIISNIEDRIGEDGISASALLGSTGETEKLARYLDAAQALFSINVLYLAWGLVAFIVILILFTNLGFFGAFCRSCGFPAFIIGTLYFLTGLGVAPLLSIVTLPVPIFAAAIEFTAGFLGAMLMDISLIVLAVGLVLIIISFISDAIRRKIDSKKNA